MKPSLTDEQMLQAESGMKLTVTETHLGFVTSAALAQTLPETAKSEQQEEPEQQEKPPQPEL